jgi:AcrR family transcriptional regulator
MAKKAKVASTAGRRWHPHKRAEQQRSLETRASILNAAIAEFAERGFEGASIRAIADRLGLQHPLITYHYRTKDILWRAAVEHAFAQIKAGWDISAPENSDLSPLCERNTLRFSVTLSHFPNFTGSCARKR